MGVWIVLAVFVLFFAWAVWHERTHDRSSGPESRAARDRGEGKAGFG